MSKKHHKFRLTPKVIIRVVIFFVVITWLISYVSNLKGYKNNINYNINLAPIYQKLPQGTRNNIESVDQKLYYIKASGAEIINNQIRAIKASIADKLANEIKTRITQE